MKNIYIDTNILLDFWFDRILGFIPAGYFAGVLFERILKCEFMMVISNYTQYELEQNFYPQEIDERLSRFREAGKLEVFMESKEIDKQARVLAKKRGIPWHDAVHVLIARERNAVIVTRDQHFDCVRDIVVVRKPEEL